MSNRPVITLRGPVRRQEGGGWEWTGIWAFGALPDDVEGETSVETPTPPQPVPIRRKKGKRKFILKGARPFRYHFCEAVDAAKVAVPWVHATSNDIGDNDTEQGERTPSPLITTTCDDSNGLPNKSEDKTSEEAAAAVTQIKTLISSNGQCSSKPDAPVDTGQQQNGIQVIVTPADPSLRASPLGVDHDDKPTRQQPSDRNSTSSAPREPHHNIVAAVEEEESSSVITNSSSSYARPVVPGSTGDKAADKPEQKQTNGQLKVESAYADSSPSHEPPKLPESSSVDVTRDVKESDPPHSVIVSNGPVDSTSETLIQQPNDIMKGIQQNSANPTITESDVTFASLTPFIDAAVKYPETCPCGGSWKGYFENVQIRKDRKSSRVSETFFLFFNSTPHPNAKSFYDLQGESKQSSSMVETNDESSSRLLPEQMHVRGMGSNQFGTFEIIGSFDISSSILHCHRMYIFTNAEEAAPIPAPRVTAGTRNKVVGAGLDSNQEKRAYFTRKKLMNWQRYDVSGGESETEKEKNRSRRRKDSEIAANTPSAATVSATIPASDISKLPRKVDSTAPRKRSLSSLPSFKTSAGSPRVNEETSASTMVTSKKARLDQRISTSDVMVLPTVSDHQNFRWKAAHIFSATKICDDPSGLPSVSIHGSEIVPDRRSITVHTVYEGEVCKGGKTREGLGVCLYENGNIYEGWWHRNKEHGKGVLMTGDRRFIIYEGDWERGRMNGKGIYYYSYNSDFVTRPPTVDGIGKEGVVLPLRVQRGGGIYKGDFKENCRHGIGVYTLPDGSVYDGEWRDNAQNGRGIFRWVDGSYYDGQWKDGKRHGIGTLKAADGFFYEGQWVNNSMEGRGWCVYPNGQRYEGALLKGKKEGRGTLQFPNGAVYEGRFKDDCIEGQGTMKIISNVVTSEKNAEDESNLDVQVDWMIPLQFQSDMSHIHQRAGFTKGGS
mmetsp:Transcript_6698/g.9718  ORF Transcript_6698/g.9718 Transcript_6698/m.9718 type:complete len:947 (-) Transcript_6698:109-2949(-)|eukprot:CAMPEP_0172432592 /NCGR_PEP_ID=MMETSP1064-20121228/64158_1 /TAXON_ID=202472 /ORGANISM="Aulacoseira subarctica , Strain CCAP 1002/5" /LENGTH=946 /DNA_ID=CAMNT_0013180027 /DNA_START=70 /DNA_END=2910 /DNA_ORIENTATION=-